MAYNMSMNYLVVRPYQNGLSTVSIVMGDDKIIEGPFESWALNDGKRVLFAHTKMHRMLKSQYMMGSYADKASYAYTYEEMCNIVTSHIGDSDRVRYEKLQPVEHAEKPVNQYVLSFGLWKIFEFSFFILFEIVKLVLTLIIIPFVLMFMNKPK